MSRTRGKTSGSSPSGSVSSDQLDSGENQQDGFSSGANSLDSNEAGDASGPTSMENKTESLSVGNSLDANPTYEVASENESLNSNDIMMPLSETASQDNSMVIIPDQSALPASTATDYSVDVIQPENTPYAENEQSEASSLKNDLLENKPFKDQNELASVAVSKKSDESNVSENDKSILERSEISSAFVDSIYQSHSDENQAHENIAEKTVLTESSDISNDNNPVVASEVILSFNEDPNDQISDFVSHEMSNVMNATPSEADDELSQTFKNIGVENSTFNSHLVSESTGSEDVEVIDSYSRNSLSSDMKLPDPIYETSDEGSVSSEKHNQDFNAYMLQEDHNIANSNQEPTPMSDDVFSDHDTNYRNLDVTYQEPSPFSEKEEKGSCSPVILDDISEKQFCYGEPTEPATESEKPITFSNALEAHEISSQEEIASNSFVTDNDGNKENITNHDIDNISSTVINPFAVDNNQKVSEFDLSANKENVQFTSTNVKDDDVRENEVHQVSDQNIFLLEGGNPFLQQSSFSDNLNTNVLQQQEYEQSSFQEKESVTSDQFCEYKNETMVGEPCELSSCEVNDVTIIKAEGSEDCIGIISSVDHDQISNNFPKQNLLSEHLKSNFEYASITDSEDSSLDSNLSQVMTVETSEKETIGGLNHTQKLSEPESVKPASNNLEQTEHPFSIEHTYNGESVSKSNGTHFCASEIISNGHRMETSGQISDQISEFHEYVQLGGNDISTVDHSKNNIFENVDAIDFSKVSPDPFLAKGNSNQISGNPFLLQDDQKQVLVTPDFYN